MRWESVGRHGGSGGGGEVFVKVKGKREGTARVERSGCSVGQRTRGDAGDLRMAWRRREATGEGREGLRNKEWRVRRGERRVTGEASEERGE